MTRSLDKITMLALAALYEATERATAAPFDQPLQLRAILWLLYQRSDRQREPYASFWQVMTEEGRGVQADYVRATYARMHWAGIVRTLGGTPEAPCFTSRITSIIRPSQPSRG